MTSPASASRPRQASAAGGPRRVNRPPSALWIIAVKHESDRAKPPHDPHELGQQVIDACLAMGFALAGIAPAAPTSRREEFLAWIAAGSHGDMDYMAEHVEERLDITKLLPGAK